MYQLSDEQMAILHERRMILLIEDAPQSNSYHQISLNKRKYRQLINFLDKLSPPEDTLLEPRKIRLPDVRSYNEVT